MGSFRSRLAVLFAVSPLFAADSSLLFNKTFGGTGNDYVNAIATDPSGYAILGGITSSYDFPVTDGSRNVATHFADTPDDGASWRPFGNLPGGTPLSLTVDSSTPPVWYATGSNGVFKSTDGGATWTDTSPHGVPKCESVGPDCAIFSLAINPAQPAIIYARSSSGVLKTTDAGATWFRLPQPTVDPNPPTYVTLDPFHPDHVFAGIVGSLQFRSFDGGQTWTQYTPPIPDPNILCSSSSPPMDFDYVTPNVVYMANNCSLFRSTDGGINWKLVAAPFQSSGVVMHPTKSGTVYVIAFGGVYVSPDGGDTWNTLLSYPSGGRFAHFLAIDPSQPSTILTNLERSLDGGATWTPLSLARDPYSIVFDPAHRGRAIAGTSGASAGFLAKLDSAGTILAATYVSAPGGASIAGVATDADGNIYGAGSANTPTGNFFAAKFDRELKSMYSAVLPGYIYAIAADLSGSAVTIAMISPGPGRQPQCLVTKLKPDGSGIVFSKMFGSTGNVGDQCSAVAADPAGNTIVAGLSYAADFPLVGNGTQTSHQGDADVIVAKFDPAGNLVYSGYLGGRARDSASAVVTDAAGNIYITGTTASKDFPTTGGAYQTSLSSNCPYPSSVVNTGFIGSITAYSTDDAFVTKLDPNGNVLFSTYLGGGCYDVARSLALDALGNIWVAGTTQSSPFPQVMPFESGPAYSYYKAFVTELDAAGGSLRLSSYVTAGSQPVIAVDPFGDAYVAGSTTPPQSAYGPPALVAPPVITGVHASLAKVQPQFVGVITIRSVGNAFSVRNGPVSPGQITQIAADGLTPDSSQDLTLTPSAHLPRSLAGVQVLFDGEAAALMSVAPGSVVAVAPYDLGGKKQTRVQVVFQGTLSAPVIADVLPDPAYLSVDGSGAGQAYARNPDGTLNSPANPAPRGSLVTLYVTGTGKPDPACPEGGVDTGSGYVCGIVQTIMRTFNSATPNMSVPNSAVTLAVK